MAATKTYTSELAALALFWAKWCDDLVLLGALREARARGHAAALSLDSEIAEIAGGCASASACW